MQKQERISRNIEVALYVEYIARQFEISRKFGSIFEYKKKFHVSRHHTRSAARSTIGK